jgi:voltage-gated potassium channel
MVETKKTYHFIWLTLSLGAMFLTSALARDLPDNQSINIVQFSSIILMFISLKSLRRDRAWLTGWIALIAFTLLLVMARSITDVHYFGYVYLALLLAFYISAAWLVGSQVLLTGSVDGNKIIGSIALYFLLGMTWAVLYTMLLEIAPSAMNGVEAASWTDNLFIMSYFSFVTLTTLGFGEISPATPTAQALVALEAITGMFYLAIVVASLIGSVHRNRLNTTIED